MNDLARYPQSDPRDSGVYPGPPMMPPSHHRLLQQQQPPEQQQQQQQQLLQQHRQLEPLPSPPSQLRYQPAISTIRTTSNNPSMNSNPASYDLQEIISQYQQHPDLLKLILASKVEEDKRRAEEAKLRAKEIDLLFQRQQPVPPNEIDVEDMAIQPRHSSDYSYIHPRAVPIRARVQSNDSVGSAGRGSIMNGLEERRLSFASQSSRYSPPVHGSSLSGVGLHRHPLSPPYSNPEDRDDDGHESSQNKKERKRREMQAITKIVETLEFPYVDDYFWKNNGNTTHKSGRRSVYYKCSNSGKGCPVNKTVTCRENGEYLIKYRGQHLPDCGRV